MTDSGSFDAGDIIYGADHLALANLIVSKCSTAGVSGLGYGISPYQAGSTITTAYINDLVAAYARAWDASSNKPGTKQSAVSVGGAITGALFQNMWTQLNQMTFAWTWDSWNETNGIGTANTFLCLMDSTTADSGETGNGGGLSGADLIITPFAALPAASGGFRSFTANPTGMQTTINFANNFLYGRSSFSWMTKVRNWTYYTSGYGMICEFYNGGQWFNLQRDGGHTCRLRLSGMGHDDNRYFTTIPPYTGTIYLGVWFNGSSLRAAWSSTKFTTWASIPSGQRVEFTGCSGTFNSFNRTGDILGYRVSNDTDFDAAWVLMSKECLIN